MHKLILGADHAGFVLKEKLKRYLIENGWRVEDLTPVFCDGDDYPPIATAVAQRVLQIESSLGLLICGTGFGMEIAANRVRGIRAVTPRSSREAKLSRNDDHANILVLGGRITSFALAQSILQTWLKTPPSKAARHVRRVRELDVLV